MELFLGRSHFLSKGKRAKRPRLLASTTTDKEEVEDMAHCLMLLSRGKHSLTDDDHHQHNYQTVDNNQVISNNNNNLYRCKTCDRVFASFQALGGHRASHKKPGKSASSEDKSNPSPSPSPRLLGHAPGVRINKAIKVHKCSLCGSVFGSGQALGGHMRRHRAGNADVASSDESPDKKPRSNVLEIDLNLPPAPEECDQHESLYGFGSREPPSLALVDCRY